jgi:hypothetical protein
VPVKAPHWVKNGPEVSISLSITWRSEWSYREEFARRWNHMVRNAGLTPRSPRRWPYQKHAKSLGYRVIQKGHRGRGQGRLNGAPPLELLVVVDTEEEFDWAAPFDRASTATRSILKQERAQAIYDRLGLTPTYVIDYPVAVDPVAADYLRSLQDAGRAEIGAHLHSWVTPPHDEVVSTYNSYQCNLPLALKRAKIEALTGAIEGSFGRRPTIFKAGRHGLGPRTGSILADLGYRIDCSLLPHHDLRADGGPDFRRVEAKPHWRAEAPGILEVPVTTGFFGAAPWLGPLLPSLFDNSLSTRLRLPGILSRSGLVSRSRLSPEGIGAAEQCRLLDALVRSGRRTFTMVYHSPSLEPGNTPYVRSEAELERFLGTIEEVLVYFRDRLGGRYTSMSALYDRMSAERGGAASPAAARQPERPQLVPAGVGAAAAAAGRGARA